MRSHRHVGETTRWRWRADMARGRPSTTPASGAHGDEEAIAEMDALDQIGDT